MKKYPYFITSIAHWALSSLKFSSLGTIQVLLLLINSPSELGTISLLAASKRQKFGSGRQLADLGRPL